MAGNIGGYISPVLPLGPGAVTSGDIGSGLILSGAIASGAIIGQAGGGAFNIASGTIATFDIGSGAIVSGRIASGQVGFGHLANSSVLSGSLGSGQVASGHLTSGLLAYIGGTVEILNTVENISGVKAVCLTSGGVAALVQAGSGLRLPTVGIVVNNYASGAAADVLRFGRFVVTSGLDSTWSGMVGRHLYAGSGGMIVTQSGLLSGMGWQKVGFAFSGGCFVNIDPTILSGGYTTPPGLF